MAVASAAIKKELLSKTRQELTVSFLISKIAKTTKIETDENGRRLFNVKLPEWDLQAKVHLNPHEYINEEAVDTTIGSIIVNKLMIEGYVESVVDNHYYNEVITKKSFQKLLDRITNALMDDKIPLNPNVVKFLQAFEFYGLMLASAVSPSLTKGVMSVQDEVREKRDELFAKYDDHPTINEAVKIEDQLTKEAAKLLKDDPGMTLFDSGSRGSFDDNYKMMSVMVGPVAVPGSTKYDVVKNNYIDGVEKSDLPAIGNTMVAAAYSRAVATADGGYLTKQFYAVYQSIAIDEPGTDCGSKGFLPVFLTPKNYADYTWQYIYDNGKLVLLDDSTKDKYMNKTVKFRSPIGCLNPKLCNKCMGERFYKLNIKNAGLTTGRMPNSIMNASLKNFHNTKVKLTTVDPDKLLI
jgi:hypothetical protein